MPDITPALEQGRDFWDRHARRDPLWAILSETEKRGGGWDVSRFFEVGVNEIGSLLYQLDSQGIEVGRGAALDFGCGVGRLTQALAPHFDRVVGVDISSSMQELATKVNRFPQTVSYICNQAADLKVLQSGSFDFVVSSIVLQHIRPDIAVSYVREFCRVLAPGGVGVFQLPSHHRRYVSRAPISSPMPDEAYRASLSTAGVPAAAVPPGTELTLDVSVTNQSAFEWARQRFGVIRVGNHWFDGTGDRMLARDDGRTSLPGTLRPGETCRLALTIKTPPDPGQYLCEVDLAHEGVVWFHDKGSAVVRFAVRNAVGRELDVGSREVQGSPAHVPATPDAANDAPVAPIAAIAGVNTEVDNPGDFPMYGVPLDAVVHVIAEQGATLVHIENDHSAGDDWVSYRYFIRSR